MNPSFDYSIENHLDTMREELVELKERLEGLKEFYNSAELSKRIPKIEDRHLVNEQIDAMEKYYTILKTRLDRFIEDEYRKQSKRF